MAANIIKEHHIVIDGLAWVIFSERRNGAPAERWKVARVSEDGSWIVPLPSHASLKEAFDRLYLQTMIG